MKYTIMMLTSLATAPVLASESLPTLIITETGYPVDIHDSLSSVDIISREDIERSGARDIADLLRFQSGMEIGRNGGPGQATSLFIRGTESDQNLILIDGIPIQSGSLGSSALHHIDPQVIQRIEIIKGPRSALWGSGAMGGVINIITQPVTSSATTANAAIEAGGDNTSRLNLGLGHTATQWQANAALSHYRSDGFSPRNDASLERGYENLSLTVGAELDLEDHQFKLKHWQTSGNVEYLGFFLNPLDQDFSNASSQLSWESDYTNKWQSRLSLSQIRDHIDQNQSNQFVHTDRSELQWRHDYLLDPDKRLAGGIVASREEVKAVGGFSPYRETTDYLETFGQYDAQWNAHHVIAGLRYLDHEHAGNRWIGSINYGYAFSQNTRLTTSLGTGFRYPSANERFGFGGNPNLKPEESLSWELSLAHQLDNQHSLHATLFRNDVTNLIDYVIVIPPFSGFNQNVAEARIEGVELQYQGQFGPWDVNLGINLQDPRNLDTDTPLLRRARHNETLSLQYQADNWSAGLDLLHSGEREDFGGITLDSYTLVNMNAQYNLSPRWQLFANIENLLDEDYELAAGFNTQDRIAFAGIRYRH
ncbi:MAG: TonB-dependent receptor domain-containing protein [bacterium]